MEAFHHKDQAGKRDHSTDTVAKKQKQGFTYGTLFSLSYGRLAFVLAGTPILTAGNVFLRWSIGEALDTGKLHLSFLYIAGALLVFSQLISYVRQILFVKVQKNLYSKIQSKVLRGSMESLVKNDLGAVTAYYTADVGQIDSFVNRILGKAFPDLVGWLITVGLMFCFDGYLGMAAILLTVLPTLFLHRMSSPIAKGSGEYQEALEACNQTVVTGLYNLETIKASCREEEFIHENNEKLAFLQKKKRKVALWKALLGAPMLVSAFGTIILLTVLSGWFVLEGRITAGQLLTVVALTDNVVTFVMSMDNTIAIFRRASVSLRRLNDFLGLEEERKEGREADQIREIAFDQIRFAYPGGAEIYHGFSERWQRGKLTFVKGGNGEGKSTLIKLLMGIYDLSAGQILINQVLAQEYSLDSLRKRIVVVPQENILFQGSIRENLVCGRKISREQMEEACRKTGIHEEILQMPKQYETIMTENGGVLSGGQKQRLCLARALLREGDVYIFDEPTSALDQKNSARFAELARELCKDRIVVVITHEKELLDEAQQVVQLGIS